ncbi:7-cyano-7-deazaguanine synthase QueC [Metallosphaera tengchongensis]|uniref:7-cyano-7-deazaguanine synthase n=1 Tax=Metallosphaera tengchongensis TaxID=1532350 RepID=A0A6N0NYW4_9CREN|nr:7-cyano-7-deazaguanine synthase QueC [Metallosphaera tengchongensis]QKR00341.1 7-cyano-7-deazaguanine synthase QueC [Metallosphaera tengchongensis]
MCSVSGVLILDHSKYEEIERKFVKILTKAEDRGRDSFGVVTLSRDGRVHVTKSIGRPSQNLEKLSGFVKEDTTVIVANNRAEPTTEFVKYKGEKDIQPFVGKRFIVTHNGIIANDHELEKKYELERVTNIDSAVLPPLLDKIWDGSIEGLRDVLGRVKGSYALVIADKERPDRLFLAQNFKPLYMAYDFGLGALFFSSLDDYFQAGPFDMVNVRKLEPYSLVEVTNSKEMRTLNLRPELKKRALVIASGGLDSTVAATKMIRDGYEVTLLHFNYRHKAEEREREAVRKIASRLNVDVIEVNTDLFSMIGNTTLLKGGGEIVKDRKGQEGAEFAHEWVPARNAIFFTVALAIAEAKGFSAIASGVNLEEAGAYPDNEMEFVRMFQRLSPYAVGPDKRVEVVMPVGNLVKHEIVKLGLQIGAPLDLTWSCYEGGDKHCGKCGPCYMRKTAFQINGVKDPVEYES